MINEKLNSAVGPIRDKLLIEKMQGLIAPILSAPEIIDSTWLVRNHWTAVPVLVEEEIQSHSERLRAAATRQGYDSCFGVRTEKGEPGAAEIAYSVPITGSALDAFQRERVGMGYALVPLDQRFIVAYSEDVFVIGGPREFLEAVLGATAQQAFDEFCRRAMRWKDLTDDAAEYFSRIESHYLRFGTRTPPEP